MVWVRFGSALVCIATHCAVWRRVVSAMKIYCVINCNKEMISFLKVQVLITLFSEF